MCVRGRHDPLFMNVLEELSERDIDSGFIQGTSENNQSM